ncbi:MAG: hypothetical protein SNG35_05205 [Rikenellaceae bacterium]
MKRVDGNPDVSLVECTNLIKGLWRIRWDIQTIDDSTTYMEQQLEHKPTAEEVKGIVLSYYNEQIDDSILSGMVYEDAQVWLSSANQFNYKAAYDLAVQSNGQSLPVTFKFGTDDEPKYREFTTIDELRDFYYKSVSYIQKTLQEGWDKKDSFDISLYE